VVSRRKLRKLRDKTFRFGVIVLFCVVVGVGVSVLISHMS